MNKQRASFVEAAGAHLLKEHGVSPMAARVAAFLLVCDPPEATLSEISAQLKASNGAMSMATQSLIGLGVVEKIGHPGQRAKRYRIAENAWPKLFFHNETSFRSYCSLADRGLKLIDGETGRAGFDPRKRLAEMGAFFGFMEEKLPGLIEEWTQVGSERVRERAAEA
ncbi:hypothetical protein JW848_02445 [Candidatus Bipolaricaulota bacterium]|nr:hypothetical protein [Candidatus Bipolaricaulota bacterium]